jgi:hypothetical protein
VRRLEREEKDATMEADEIVDNDSTFGGDR